MSPADNIDVMVRLATFKWLDENVDRFDGVFPREVLAKGFIFKETRVPLVGPQGIFKPAILPEIPLSITTTPNSPYRDSSDEMGLSYSYTGTDPDHWQNVGLRKAMQEQIPLVYFKAEIAGRYAAEYPAYIVGDDPDQLMFEVVFGDVKSLYAGKSAAEDKDVRAYITRETKVRLHQKSFPEMVLHAYVERCACCRLHHRRLLDAAHIIGDKEPAGLPVVSNGLALCKLHHAAFDGNFFGIRPDYVIEVRKDVREEKDGPMLLHGLQGLHETKIIVPRSENQAPNHELLEMRFERFRQAG